jgi:DNA (cytosine-5)-methyltransferase 1
MTFGSLFTGVGGLDLGLERAGLRCLWQVEADPWCRLVLARRWPNVSRYCDARDFPPRVRSPRRYYGVDLICGGDPCQENSRARVASGLSQESLGDQFVRIVGELRPRFVLRENPAAVRPDAPWPWQRFRAELEGLGYAVLPFRLRACCLGADHRRERMFLLAELSHADRKPVRMPRRPEDVGPSGTVPRATWQRERLRADARAVLRGEWDIDDAGSLRVPDGLSRRMDGRRMKGCGNAVHVAVSEWIGRTLVNSASP